MSDMGRQRPESPDPARSAKPRRSRADSPMRLVAERWAEDPPPADDPSQAHGGLFLGDPFAAGLLSRMEAQSHLRTRDRSHELPQPEVRSATALFTDLRGFSGLAENLRDHPASLLALLNEHLAEVVRAVLWNRGVVEKFVGDGILVTFGARATESDDQERALGAAMGVIAANEALNRRRADAWGFRLDVAVALATGPVAVGAVGSQECWEWGVLGDPINVASRLVGVAQPGEVLLTAGVYRGLRGHFPGRLLGPAAVRGRRSSVTVYSIQASDLLKVAAPGVQVA